jgi:hypothetical protein
MFKNTDLTTKVIIASETNEIVVVTKELSGKIAI